MNRENNLSPFAAPLYDSLIRYAKSGCMAFHTPGHKQGKGASERIFSLLTPLGLKADVSLADELDDPFQPTGCLQAAQELAAQYFGARETIFSVSGTTGAIQMMLLAALNPNDKIIVTRGAHRSLLDGLILADAIPAYIDPEYDVSSLLPLNITPAAVQSAIEKHPDAKAVFLVSPSYYGIAADLEKIAAITHAAKMLLLVDEAHGAHLKSLSEAPSHHLPPIDALTAGADLVAQSTHKLLGSLTQTSFLHIGKTAPPDMAERVYRAYGITQTTSPNYLLFASLDLARAQMAAEGTAKVAFAAELAFCLQQKINAIPHLKAYTLDEAAKKHFKKDLTKIVVDVTGLDITGQTAWEYLRQEKLIQPEMTDRRRIVFIISYADDENTAKKLYEGLKALSEKYRNQLDRPFSSRHSKIDTSKLLPPPAPENIAPLSPRAAYFSPRESVPFAQAVGRIAAEAPLFYPPGIPAFYPGEIITPAAIEYLLAGKNARLSLKISDQTLETLQVIKNSPKKGTT